MIEANPRAASNEYEDKLFFLEKTSFILKKTYPRDTVLSHNQRHALQDNQNDITRQAEDNHLSFRSSVDVLTTLFYVQHEFGHTRN